MKKVISSFVLCLLVMSGMDFAMAAPAGRVGTQNKIMSTARMPTMSIKTTGVTTGPKTDDTPVPTTVEPTKPSTTPEVDKREKEREACLRNNIGVGNTFVWASRYSDINNYATMVEDTEVPDNNTCFVRVELKSDDSRVDLSNIPGKYFEMGRNITCGSWVKEDDIEKRILNAKKTGRALATVGGAVGGAALGVGSMELFGNKAINGAVEGQKSKKLSAEEQFRSYVLTLNASERNKLIEFAKKMNDLCTKEWKEEYMDKPDECKGIDIDNGTYVSYGYIAGIK